MAVVNVSLRTMAAQWTGANVTDIRQVVRAGLGAYNDAVIDAGVLYIFASAAGVPVPDVPRVEVPVGHWLVTSDPFNPLSPAAFAERYTILP